MAITVIQTPAADSSVHSPLWFVVGSLSAVVPGFRYVFDIYTGTASSNTFITRLKISPGADGRGVVDISRIIRSYLKNYFAPVVTAGAPYLINTGNIAIEYGVSYREETVSGGVATVSPVRSTTWSTAYNSYNNDTPSSGFPYSPTRGLEYNWITSRDLQTVWMRKTGVAFLSYLNDPSEAHTMDVQALDESGNPSGAIYLTNSFNAPGKLIVINLNPASIDAPGYQPVGGTGPTPSAVATSGPAANGYRMRMYRADNTTVTPWVYVRYLCEAKAKATPLHFLNRFGGFDTFYFTGPTRREVDLERKTYQRIPMISVNDVIREFDTRSNVFADTTLQYNTQHTWTRKLNSGYLNDKAYAWLWQLVASPQVYLEEGGCYFPVTIKTQQWTEKLTRFDKMYNLELEITMGRQVFSQSR